MNPAFHRCDERSIDYSSARDGNVRCECGREWVLGARGWNPSPLTRRRP